MGSVYNGLQDPDGSVAQATALGLNTIRITDFLDADGAPTAAAFDETRWRRVDRLIAAASAAGLHVVLDLSSYRNLLKASGRNPYTYDWSSFLSFAADRRNTVTKLRYGDDPTIALVGFAGEVDAVNGGDNTYGLTTAQLTDFFRQVEGHWHRAAPRQLLTAGGLMQLDWDSGIGWKAIFDLPHNDVDAIHVYSSRDRDKSLPAVAVYSRTIGKPWITEEFGYPAALGDGRRASAFAATYDLNERHGSAGVGFWNVGRQTKDTFDVGPQFPRTFRAVRSYWPR